MPSIDAFCLVCPHDTLDDTSGGFAQLRDVVDGRIDKVVQHAECFGVVSRAALSRIDVRVVSFEGDGRVSFRDEGRPLVEAFVALSYVELRTSGEPHRGAVALDAGVTQAAGSDDEVLHRTSSQGGTSGGEPRRDGAPLLFDERFPYLA